MSVIRYTNYCKLLLLECLRTAFGSSSVPAEYKYVANEDDPACKLRIYRELPRRQFNPPLITVSASAGDASIKYLNNETVKEVFIVYSELVQSNTLAYVPLSINSLVKVAQGTTVTDEAVASDNYLAYSPLTSVTSVSNPTKTTHYTLGSDFTVDLTTGFITWVTAQPASYICSYVVPLQYLPTGTTYILGTNYTVNTYTGVITWITTPPAHYACTYLTFSDVAGVTYPAGKWVQSSLEVPVRVTVYALSTTDRERITDLVVLYLRHVFREFLTPYMTYVKIRLGDETTTPWSNQVVYVNTVTID